MSLGLGAFCSYAAFALLSRGDAIGYGFVGVALLAAWSTVKWLRRWRRRQPAISLTEQGIVDGTGMGRPTLIPWPSIESMVYEGKSLRIRLFDDGSVRVPVAMRMLATAARRSHREYLLPTALLDTPGEVIAAVAGDWHESLLLEEVRAERGLVEGASDGGAVDA